MTVERIHVKNFKSFNNLDVGLDNFNVVIGANASGKSNFIQIFKFIRDIQNLGLDNAISMQGGTEYLRNIKLGPSENLTFEIIVNQKFSLPFLVIRPDKTKHGEPTVMKGSRLEYRFSLSFNKKGKGFKIIEDILTIKGQIFNQEMEDEKLKKEMGEGEIIFFVDKQRLDAHLSIPEELGIEKDHILPLLFFKSEKIPSDTLLIELPLLTVLGTPGISSNFAIYDFDPKLSKRAVPISGKVKLEENGENLASVIKNILKNKDSSRKLANLLQDLLPFVNKIDVEKFAAKSLFFKLEETYAENKYLPAPLISDGTINIIALIVALYFQRKSFTIIEEPERNIHPHLISGVVQMMEEASSNKQIIITTHNPEVVKHVDLNNVLLISRDENGFSKISRPSEKEDVQTFLENEIGIEDLYTQNLLRG